MILPRVNLFWAQGSSSINILNYSIQIERDSCDSIGIIIQNYGNISNSMGPLNVSAHIRGDSIWIPFQIIEVPEQIF